MQLVANQSKHVFYLFNLNVFTCALAYFDFCNISVQYMFDTDMFSDFFKGNLQKLRPIYGMHMPTHTLFNILVLSYK